MIRLIRKLRKNTKSLKNRKIWKHIRLSDESSFSDISYSVSGSNHNIVLGKGSVIDNMQVAISGNNHQLIIGENCIVKNLFVRLEFEGCTIKIGANTSVESGHIGVAENGSIIEIGEDCMLSNDIDIRSSDSHGIFDVTTKERINHAGNVRIGDHSWIGAKATILKGVTIGKNAVVGLGSVVTKDVPENSVVGGNPAKLIRNNINWTRKI